VLVGLLEQRHRLITAVTALILYFHLLHLRVAVAVAGLMLRLPIQTAVMAALAAVRLPMQVPLELSELALPGKVVMAD
jgi:hypothetical protein